MRCICTYVMVHVGTLRHPNHLYISDVHSSRDRRIRLLVLTFECVAIVVIDLSLYMFLALL